MRRKIHNKCGIIINAPAIEGEEHYCGAPVVGISEHGVLVCKEHADLLVSRKVKVTKVESK